MEKRNQILNLITSTVRSYEPEAEIILYGSRARGTNRDDSDWDVLVLVNEPKITDKHREIDYVLWDKGLTLGEEINTTLRTKSEWNQTVSLFKHHIAQEGIPL